MKNKKHPFTRGEMQGVISGSEKKGGICCFFVYTTILALWLKIKRIIVAHQDKRHYPRC
jgi:hypothetical protein